MLRVNIYVNNYKQWKNVLRYVKLAYKPLFKIRFPKSGLTYRKQVVDPRHQTPQKQSVPKTETPLYNIIFYNITLA